jgi:hypothetical protein
MVIIATVLVDIINHISNLLIRYMMCSVSWLTSPFNKKFSSFLKSKFYFDGALINSSEGYEGWDGSGGGGCCTLLTTFSTENGTKERRTRL